ncbi:lipocalin family protein [Marinobacter orientalis]|uniref:Outer membrane lipoprotein Blc n=1 Tax=Marinobacter orientalis TaxID=1928859 RepID=A0A7Y0REM9_9GAMM|nr:lipocalin family protein [Marinobacter orientalis]NMT64820.1 lipocalin [Marinobacter orientalis]TGX48811.1 lipocalin [Marinobacter orientalis]
MSNAKSLIMSAVLVLAGCTGVPDGIEPVSDLDVERYKGTWYEIARLDHSFEEGLSNVTADYSLQDDGSIRVINRGYSEEDGKWEEAEGRAVFVDDEANGHLKVSFFGPFYASYVVFRLDQDYRFAYITGYDRDYVWFLSRTPTVDDETLAEFKKTAEARGFDLDELIIVDQSRNR